MSAFVPGFEHDVFISYAQVDNQALIPGNLQSQWVDTFVNLLQAQLDMKLGRRGLASIWKDDRQLRGNDPLSPDIERAVQNSAALVVILSEGYLASPWCQRERELFLTRAGGDPGERLFIVDLGAVDLDRRPTAFRDRLGYAFHRRESDGDIRTLGRPLPRDSDIDYYQRVDDLARDLADTLRALKTARDAPAPVATDDTPDRPAVFLAETTPDLDDLHDNLRRHLDQTGVRVLPGRVYPRDPDDFRAAMDADLGHCRLFVQLLGPYVSRRTENLPDGYEGLQLERAASAGLPILRWHDPDLDTSRVRDPAFLARLPVLVMGFEDFKREILQQLRRQQEDSAVAPAGDDFVLVSAQRLDTPVADQLTRALDRHAIGYEVVDERHALEDLVHEDIYSALMVIYGQCPEDWVREQIRRCRRIMLELKTRAPVCAIYVGPPADKEPLRIKPPRFHFLDATDPDSLPGFVTALRRQRSQP